MGELIGFAAVTMPIWIVWIVMHYKAKHRAAQGFSEEERKQLDELTAAADNMAERIKSLETILDAEAPEWRDYHGQK